MAILPGNEQKLVIKKATTWGTAVAATSGDLAAINSFENSVSVDELESNQLGLGQSMRTDISHGNITVEGSLEMAVGWQNKADVILASFFGDPQAPVEQTVGQGDYLHVLLADTSLHQNGYITFAQKATTTDVIEFPTAAIQSITLSHDEPTSDLILSADFLASERELSTSVNTLAVVDASTLATQTKLKVRKSSRWMLNLRSGGALTAPTDVITPISASIQLSRAMEILNEVANTTASPVPTSDGFLEGTLELTFAGLEDLTYYTGFDNETFYKASLFIEGDQIGTGVKRSFEIRFPSLKLMPPENSLSDPGNNELTLSFNIFAAESNPTGMTSVRPHIRLINTRSTSY